MRTKTCCFCSTPFMLIQTHNCDKKYHIYLWPKREKAGKTQKKCENRTLYLITFIFLLLHDRIFCSLWSNLSIHFHNYMTRKEAAEMFDFDGEGCKYLTGHVNIAKETWRKHKLIVRIKHKANRSRAHHQWAQFVPMVYGNMIYLNSVRKKFHRKLKRISNCQTFWRFFFAENG